MTWSELEKRVLHGTRDMDSTLELISAFRRYRRAASKLIATRYTDGSCDGPTMHTFVCQLDDINKDHE